MQTLPLKIAFGSLALGIGFTVLFSTAQNLGINVPLLQLLLIGVAYWLASETKKPFSRDTWIAAAFALAFSATFAIWTSSYGLGLSMFGLIVSNILFALFLLGHHGHFPHPVHAVLDSLYYLALRTLSRFEILAHIRLPQLSNKGNAILRGTIVAIPVLLVFLALFLSADAVLREASDTFIQDLFGSRVFFKRIGQGVLIGIVTVITLPILATAFWRQLSVPALTKRAAAHATEISVVLGLLNTLFLAFILFQSYYLFGGAAAFASIEGITYAEYARQGFGELAAVSLLVFFLILTARHFHSEKSHPHVKLLEFALLFQTGILVISAWQRLHLYVEQYAYTPARLFGFWFFALILVLLALFAYHIHKEDVQEKFLSQAMVIVGIAILAFTALAPDALTLRLNIAHANRTGKIIETRYLQRELSAEAYPVMAFIHATMQHDADTFVPLEHIAKNQTQAKNNYSERIQHQVCEKVWADGVRLYPQWKESRNETTYQRTKKDWRVWNLSRTQLPACTLQPQWQPGLST